MILLQEPRLGTFSECPYLADREWRFEYFFALDLAPSELEAYLARGWRKFGYYFFRPQCEKCFECIPLRVLVQKFSPSKSQRRVFRKGRAIRVEFNPLEYRKEIFEIYSIHSRERFNNEVREEDFIESFFTPSCPSLQSEYYIDDTLAAVGFLDRSDRSLSSIYFVYDTAFSEYRLGTYSALTEIAYAAQEGFDYYYLGYYVAGNSSMAYKAGFRPHELYHWDKERWEKEDRHEKISQRNI